MPSVDQLNPDQVRRRVAVLTTLGQAGWQPDNVLWDAGIATDFVASMISPDDTSALRCDYVIASDGGGLPEHLSVQWTFPHGPVRLIVDFLKQTETTRDHPGSEHADGTLGTTLDLLVESTDRAAPGIPTPAEAAAAAAAIAATLAGICPVFTVDLHGRLVPFGANSPGVGAHAGTGLDPADADGPVQPESEPHAEEPLPDTDEGAPEVLYADEVEDRLYHELVPAGWRRSPADAVLSGSLETFYVDCGPVQLSAGRCNGEETLVRVTVPDTSVHLRVDDMSRPEHADRFVSLLLHWQARITTDTWRDFVSDLAASYPRVLVEDTDGNWNQVRTREPRRPAAPPRGAQRRGEAISARLAQSGWAAVAGGPAVSMYTQNTHRTTLRCDHAVEVFADLSEALVLDVQLAEPVAPFGAGVTLALDVFDLVSGRGNRDGMLGVLDILTARQDGLAAATLPGLIGALSLCCPVFAVTETGDLQALAGLGDTGDLDDLPLPVPRPLEEIDRLLAAGVETTADLWLERGLAALADDRPDLALDSFDEAIRCDPGSGPAHLHRARLLRHTDVEEAARSLLRCAELGYAPWLALAWYGALLLDNGRLDDALGVFRHLTETLPEYGPGWYERGVTALAVGRYEEAVEATATAVRLTPEHPGAFYVRGCAYARTGHPDLALDDLTRALELDGSLRARMTVDEHLVSLHGHDRFAKLIDAWPAGGPADSDAELDPALAEALGRGGWRPDELSVSLGRFSVLEYHCPAGTLVVGHAGGREPADEESTEISSGAGAVYVTLRSVGAGGSDEAWLYTSVESEGRAFGALLVDWQDRLSPATFPDFADEVRVGFPRTSWHWGRP